VNIFQAINNAMFVGTLVGLISALSRTSGTLSEKPLSLWLFSLFFFLLRLKIFLDDHQYFGGTQTKNRRFKVGFVVGALSWAAWIFAGLSLSNLSDAYLLTILALLISIIWIAIAMFMRNTNNRKQVWWLIGNALYLCFLWVAYYRNMPSGDTTTWAVLGLAILVALLDMIFSSSIPELDT